MTQPPETTMAATAAAGTTKATVAAQQPAAHIPLTLYRFQQQATTTQSGAGNAQSLPLMAAKRVYVIKCKPRVRSDFHANFYGRLIPLPRSYSPFHARSFFRKLSQNADD